MRKTPTDKGVAALKPRATRYHEPDPQLPSHYVRVEPTAGKTFWVVQRDPAGKQKWTKTGDPNLISIDASRDIAREVIKRVRTGLDAFEAPPVKLETFEHVAEQWLKRHVRKKGLLSEQEVTRLLRSHVYPAWENRPFLSIRRSAVTALLDEVGDDHGDRQADYV